MIPSLFPWKLYDFPPNPSPPPGDGKNWSLIQKSRAFKSAFSYYRMCTVLKILKARFKCCVIVTSAFSQTQAHHLPAAQI